MENKDKPKQVPKTIENCRVKDETFISDLQNDPEIQLDLRTDELSRHLMRPVADEDASSESEPEDQGEDDSVECKNGEEENVEDEGNEDEFESDDEENTEPKILITTHDIKVSLKTYKLCRELARILPNAQYFYRKHVRLSKIFPEAIKRKYSAVIVINEDRKIPSKAFLYIQIEKKK